MTLLFVLAALLLGQPGIYASDICKEGLVKYFPFKSAKLRYTAELGLGLASTLHARSIVRIVSSVQLHVQPKCGFVLEVGHVDIFELNPNKSSAQPSTNLRYMVNEIRGTQALFGINQNSEVISLRISKNADWGLGGQFIRGLVSLFQVKSHNSSNYLQSDVTGNWSVTSLVTSEEDSIQIIKRKTGKEGPIMMNTSYNSNLFSSQSALKVKPSSNCIYQIRSTKFHRVDCQEELFAVLVPMAELSAMYAETSQSLMVLESSAVPIRESWDEASFVRVTWSMSPRSPQADTRSFYTLLHQTVLSQVYRDEKLAPLAFTELRNVMSLMTYPKLRDALATARACGGSDQCKHPVHADLDVFVDALMFCSSRSCSNLLHEILAANQKHGLSPVYQRRIVSSFNRIKSPTAAHLQMLRDACLNLYQQSFLFCWTQLGRTLSLYCQSGSCTQGSSAAIWRQAYDSILMAVQPKKCTFSKESDVDRAIYVMKGIKGPAFRQAAQALLDCANQQDHLNVSIAALRALGRIELSARWSKDLMEVLQDKNMMPRKRIEAFLSLVHNVHRGLAKLCVDIINDPMDSLHVRHFMFKFIIANSESSRYPKFQQMASKRMKSIKLVLEDSFRLSTYGQKDFQFGQFIMNIEYNWVYSQGNLLPSSLWLSGRASNIHLFELQLDLSGAEEKLFAPYVDRIRVLLQEAGGPSSITPMLHFLQGVLNDPIVKGKINLSAENIPNFHGFVSLSVMHQEVVLSTMADLMPQFSKKSTLDLFLEVIEMVSGYESMSSKNIMLLDETMLVSTAIGVPLSTSFQVSLTQVRWTAGKAELNPFSMGVLKYKGNFFLGTTVGAVVSMQLDVPRSPPRVYAYTVANITVPLVYDLVYEGQKNFRLEHFMVDKTQDLFGITSRGFIELGSSKKTMVFPMASSEFTKHSLCWSDVVDVQSIGLDQCIHLIHPSVPIDSVMLSYPFLVPVSVAIQSIKLHNEQLVLSMDVTQSSNGVTAVLRNGMRDSKVCGYMELFLAAESSSFKLLISESLRGFSLGHRFDHQSMFLSVSLRSNLTVPIFLNATFDGTLDGVLFKPVLNVTGSMDDKQLSVRLGSEEVQEALTLFGHLVLPKMPFASFNLVQLPNTRRSDLHLRVHPLRAWMNMSIEQVPAVDQLTGESRGISESFQINIKDDIVSPGYPTGSSCNISVHGSPIAIQLRGSSRVLKQSDLVLIVRPPQDSKYLPLLWKSNPNLRSWFDKSGANVVSALWGNVVDQKFLAAIGAQSSVLLFCLGFQDQLLVVSPKYKHFQTTIDVWLRDATGEKHSVIDSKLDHLHVKVQSDQFPTEFNMTVDSSHLNVSWECSQQKVNAYMLFSSPEAPAAVEYGFNMSDLRLSHRLVAAQAVDNSHSLMISEVFKLRLPDSTMDRSQEVLVQPKQIEIRSISESGPRTLPRKSYSEVMMVNDDSRKLLNMTWDLQGYGSVSGHVLLNNRLRANCVGSYAHVQVNASTVESPSSTSSSVRILSRGLCGGKRSFANSEMLPDLASILPPLDDFLAASVSVFGMKMDALMHSANLHLRLQEFIRVRLQPKAGSISLTLAPSKQVNVTVSINCRLHSCNFTGFQRGSHVGQLLSSLIVDPETGSGTLVLYRPGIRGFLAGISPQLERSLKGLPREAQGPMAGLIKGLGKVKTYVEGLQVTQYDLWTLLSSTMLKAATTLTDSIHDQTPSTQTHVLIETLHSVLKSDNPVVLTQSVLRALSSSVLTWLPSLTSQLLGGPSDHPHLALFSNSLASFINNLGQVSARDRTVVGEKSTSSSASATEKPSVCPKVVRSLQGLHHLSNNYLEFNRTITMLADLASTLGAALSFGSAKSRGQQENYRSVLEKFQEAFTLEETTLVAGLINHDRTSDLRPTIDSINKILTKAFGTIDGSWNAISQVLSLPHAVHILKLFAVQLCSSCSQSPRRSCQNAVMSNCQKDLAAYTSVSVGVKSMTKLATLLVTEQHHLDQVLNRWSVDLVNEFFVSNSKAIELVHLIIGADDLKSAIAIMDSHGSIPRQWSSIFAVLLDSNSDLSSISNTARQLLNQLLPPMPDCSDSLYPSLCSVLSRERLVEFILGNASIEQITSSLLQGAHNELKGFLVDWDVPVIKLLRNLSWFQAMEATVLLAHKQALTSSNVRLQIVAKQLSRFIVGGTLDWIQLANVLEKGDDQLARASADLLSSLLQAGTTLLSSFYYNPPENADIFDLLDWAISWLRATLRAALIMPSSSFVHVDQMIESILEDLNLETSSPLLPLRVLLKVNSHRLIGYLQVQTTASSVSLNKVISALENKVKVGFSYVTRGIAMMSKTHRHMTQVLATMFLMQLKHHVNYLSQTTQIRALKSFDTSLKTLPSQFIDAQLEEMVSKFSAIMHSFLQVLKQDLTQFLKDVQNSTTTVVKETTGLLEDCLSLPSVSKSTHTQTISAFVLCLVEQHSPSSLRRKVVDYFGNLTTSYLLLNQLQNLLPLDSSLVLPASAVVNAIRNGQDFIHILVNATVVDSFRYFYSLLQTQQPVLATILPTVNIAHFLRSSPKDILTSLFKNYFPSMALQGLIEQRRSSSSNLNESFFDITVYKEEAHLVDFNLKSFKKAIAAFMSKNNQVELDRFMSQTRSALLKVLEATKNGSVQLPDNIVLLTQNDLEDLTKGVLFVTSWIGQAVNGTLHHLLKSSDSQLVDRWLTVLTVISESWLLDATSQFELLANNSLPDALWEDMIRPDGCLVELVKPYIIFGMHDTLRAASSSTRLFLVRSLITICQNYLMRPLEEADIKAINSFVQGHLESAHYMWSNNPNYTEWFLPTFTQLKTVLQTYNNNMFPSLLLATIQSWLGIGIEKVEESIDLYVPHNANFTIVAPLNLSLAHLAEQLSLKSMSRSLDHLKNLPMVHWLVMAWNPMEHIPPPDRVAIMFDKNVHTFDGQYLQLPHDDIKGWLVLAKDFKHDTFTLLLHKNQEKLVLLTRHSMVILNKYNQMELYDSSWYVRQSNSLKAKSDFPQHTKSLVVFHMGHAVVVQTLFGVRLMCIAETRSCTLSVPWYLSGAVRGVYGTPNNEITDDIIGGDGQRKLVQLLLVNSWIVGAGMSTMTPRLCDIKPSTCSSLKPLLNSARIQDTNSKVFHQACIEDMHRCMTSPKKEHCRSSVAMATLMASKNLHTSKVQDCETCPTASLHPNASKVLPVVIAIRMMNASARWLPVLRKLGEALQVPLYLNGFLPAFSVVGYGGPGLYGPPHLLSADSSPLDFTGSKYGQALGNMALGKCTKSCPSIEEVVRFVADMPLFGNMRKVLVVVDPDPVRRAPTVASEIIEDLPGPTFLNLLVDWELGQGVIGQSVMGVVYHQNVISGFKSDHVNWMNYAEFPLYHATRCSIFSLRRALSGRSHVDSRFYRSLLASIERQLGAGASDPRTCRCLSYSKDIDQLVKQCI